MLGGALIMSANQRLKFPHHFVNLSKHLNGFSGPKARWLLFNCTRWRHRFSEILGARSSATQVGFQIFKISAFDWSKTFLKTILRAASSNASWNWNININPENEKLRAEGGFSNSCFWLSLVETIVQSEFEYLYFKPIQSLCRFCRLYSKNWSLCNWKVPRCCQRMFD